MKKIAVIAVSLAMAFSMATTVSAAEKVSASANIREVSVGASDEIASVTGLLQQKYTSNSVTVSWDKNESAEFYNVYKENDGEYEFVGKVTECTYTLEALPASVSKIMVKAGVTEADGTEKLSNGSEISAYTSPEAINGIDVTYKKISSVGLSWSAVAGADSYSIYRYILSTNEYEFVKEVTNTSADINDLTSDTEYNFVICSNKIVSEDVFQSNYSNSVTVMTNISAPKNLKITKTSVTAIAISWDSVDGANYYDVYKYNSSTKKYDYLKTTMSTNCVADNLVGGKVYTFRVKAVTVEDGKNIASGYSDRILAFANPYSPKKVRSNVSTSGIQIAWAKSAGASEYKIYYSESFSGVYKYLKTVTSVSANVVMPSKMKKYYFRVVAVAKYETVLSDSIYSARVSQYMPSVMPIKLATTIMSGGKFATHGVIKVAKGQKIAVLYKTGNWYKCSYLGKIGYIYNMALTGKANVNRLNVTAATLDTFFDDMVFRLGKSIKNYFYELNSYSYFGNSFGDRNILGVGSLVSQYRTIALRTVKTHSGRCYGYASMAAILFQRAGIKVKLVYCHHTLSNNFHCFNRIYYNGKWRYFDACRYGGRHDGWYESDIHFQTTRDCPLKNIRLSAALN